MPAVIEDFPVMHNAPDGPVSSGSAGLQIRVGIGGWVFAPWRGSFYPSGLPQRHELNYASRRLGAIEINGTYYGA